MKTIKELAEHLSGRMVWIQASKPPPGEDISRREIADIYDFLREKELMVRDSLDRKLAEHIQKKTQLDLSPWEDWFRSQRWICAADWCGRLADSLPAPAPLLLEKTVSIEQLYHWLQIPLWSANCDRHLQNVALELSLSSKPPVPPS